ncbi:MAG TPA: hypothetical protein VFB79_10580 [Candidatus Angelobacter sp.]|nr:hypothetical protein [Candidatus Angelobacter sp.]
MILKVVLLLWFMAFMLSLVGKGGIRNWMPRLFIGGFFLLLLGIFLKLISRVL